MVRLLVVDDEEEIRNGIINVINWSSHDITICGGAENGNEALRLIEETSPDILLVDIRMPILDGLELIEILTERKSHVKSIILSGYDDFSYAQKALKLGASDYLLKPCRPKEILDTVLKVKSCIETEKKRDDFLKELKEKFGEDVLLSEESESAKSLDNKRKCTNRLVQIAVNYINENFHHELDLEIVANQLLITPGYLSLLFKQTMDINFVEYIHKIRIKKACDLLKKTALKNYEIAYNVGYSDEKYFSQIFKKHMGMTPSQYRNSI